MPQQAQAREVNDEVRLPGAAEPALPYDDEVRLPDTPQIFPSDVAGSDETTWEEFNHELRELCIWVEENVPTKLLPQLAERMQALTDVQKRIASSHPPPEPRQSSKLSALRPRLLTTIRRASLTAWSSTNFHRNVVPMPPAVLWAIRLALAGTGFCAPLCADWAQQSPNNGVSVTQARFWAGMLFLCCCAIGYLGVSGIPHIAPDLELALPLGIWLLAVCVLLGGAETVAVDHLRRVIFATNVKKGTNRTDESDETDEEQDEANTVSSMADKPHMVIDLLSANTSKRVAKQIKIEFYKACVMALAGGGCAFCGGIFAVIYSNIIGGFRWDHKAAFLLVSVTGPVAMIQFFIGLNFCPTLLCVVLSDSVRRLAANVRKSSMCKDRIDYDALLAEASNVHEKIDSVANVLKTVQVLIMCAYIMVASCFVVAGAGPRPPPDHRLYTINTYFPRWLALLAAGVCVLLGISVMFIPAKITASCDDLVISLNRLRMDHSGRMAQHADLIRVDALEHFVRHIQSAGMMGYAVFATRISYGFVLLLLTKTAAAMGVFLPALVKLGLLSGGTW